MSSFSQRNNYSPVRVEIQLESLDTKTRTHLWNIVYNRFIERFIKQDNNYNYSFEARDIWANFLELPANLIPQYDSHFKDRLQTLFFQGDWYVIFDFIEFVLNMDFFDDYRNGIIESCNKVLEKELSAYRIVNNQFVQITNKMETESIEEAINSTKDGIKTHLSRSLELLSDRQNPDYRNSIKEAISAVEAFCIEITGDPKATLGEALKHPKLKDVFHGSLLKGFSNFYGFTSNAQGIRHALMDEPTLKQEDAIFMLVSCSAFVNYLRAKI